MRLFVPLIAILLGAFVSSAPCEEKSISIELKNFKFKSDMPDLFGLNEDEGKLFYYTNGVGEATFKAADGECEIIIEASCDAAQNEFAKFKVALDGEAVGKETTLTTDEKKEYKFKAKLKAGERKIAIEFTNDVYKENEYDRNFYVHSVTIKPAK